MKRSFLAALTVTALAAPALAADLPQGGPPPYYPPPPPVFLWSGFYLGANGGFGFGKFTQGGSGYFGNMGGGLVGVTAGYNYQTGPVVLGVEGDVDFSGLRGDHGPFPGVRGTGNITSEGSIRARVGYTFDRTLLYITGGYTGANLRGDVTDLSSAPNNFASQSVFLNGFVLGGGLEFAMTRNISVKAEYLFSDYGNTNLFANTPDRITTGAYFSTVRAGINYHF